MFLAFGCLSVPYPTNAFCGDIPPSWVYSIPFEDGQIKFGSGELFIRLVGDKKKEIASKGDLFLNIILADNLKSGLPVHATVRPLLVIPGGPGLPCDYLENFEAVTKLDRRVLEFDPLGTGRSPFAGATRLLMVHSSFLALCDIPIRWVKVIESAIS
jgi:pimeloyl-ACP methyl ester carboxylesterase